MDMLPAFYFDTKRLKELATQKCEEFLNAKPFPHVVVDDFIDQTILDLVDNEFPKPDDVPWNVWGPGPTKRTHSRLVDKLGISAETQFGPFTRHFMHLLNSRPFLEFVEALTNVKGIIPDPSFNACGLHSTGPGGRLMIHVDHNRWPIRGQLHQRFNMILFLNKNWKEEYGGHLELWNHDATRCEKKILPIFNRMVIFDTGRFSYHGHPEPVSCPQDRRRNSLAVYYYVFDRPIDENYQGIQSIEWIPTTKTDRYWGFLKSADAAAQRLTPPVVWELVSALRRKRK